MRKQFLSTLTATALCLTSSVAFAERGGPVSIAEIEERAEERFNKVDANSDGLISQDEFMAHEPKRSFKGKRRHHGRGHGGQRRGPQLSDEQRAEVDEAVFAELDANNSGVIEANELSREAMRDAKRTVHKERLFARLDANGDGSLDRDELPNRAAHARDADTDGDGMLSREERRAARKARHAERQAMGGAPGQG